MKSILSRPYSSEHMIRAESNVVDEKLIDSTIRALVEAEVSSREQNPGFVQVSAPESEAAVAASRQTDWRKMRRLYPDKPPRWRVSLGILLVALFIGWPFQFLGFVCLFLAALVIPYLTIGHDRSMEIAARGYDLLCRLSPRLAEHLRDWAASRTASLEHWLSCLPERWTAGLYLPDFGSEASPPDKVQMDPFDRLYDRLHRQDTD